MIRVLTIVCYTQLLICICTEQALSDTGQNDENRFLTTSNSKDDALFSRWRRGLPIRLRSLLQRSTMIYQAKNYEVYRRRGGTSLALKDWEALKPRNVADFGITKWGDVGDRTVMLDLEGGKAILNILASKTTPEGDITRIVSRVKYSEVPRPPIPVSKN